MTLNQLVYFRQLAHTQHYGYAAERLFVSQPSISRAIAQLEDELDVELFAREGRNVVLTRAGHVFLEYVEQSLDTLNIGISRMQRFSRQAEVLSIGCITPFLERNPFYDELIRIAGMKNGSRLDMQISQTVQLLEWLKKHRYDLVFCSYDAAQRDVRFVPVMELPWVVAMRPDDPLAREETITPETLRNRELVVNAEPIYSALIRRIFDERHIVPRVKASANEDAVLLNMVSQGVGLLIGSDHRQTHTADTLLKPLKQDAVHRYIYIAYLKNGAYTSAVEQIIAFVEAHALQEEGTQPRSGFAPANCQTTA